MLLPTVRTEFIVQALRLVALLCTFGMLAGCTQMGPKTIPTARFDYAEVIGSSNRESTLLQLVQLRYSQLPVILEVSQIVAGYNQDQFFGWNWDIRNPFNAGKDEMGAGYNLRLTERPTITYSLLTGQHFVRGYLTSVSPEAVFALATSGWPIDRLLWMTAQSVNGQRSFRLEAGKVAEPSAAFRRFVAVMRALQLQDAWSVVGTQGEKGAENQIRFHRALMEPATEQELGEVLSLLGLDPASESVGLGAGLTVPGAHTLVVRTRSLMQMMIVLSTQVEVPPDHLRDGVAQQLLNPTTGQPLEGGVAALALGEQGFTVHSGAFPPPDAYVTVKHQGRYFWISNTDIRSKAMLAYVELLQLINENSDPKNPTLTISAN